MSRLLSAFVLAALIGAAALSPTAAQGTRTGPNRTPPPAPHRMPMKPWPKPPTATSTWRRPSSTTIRHKFPEPVRKKSATATRLKSTDKGRRPDPAKLARLRAERQKKLLVETKARRQQEQRLAQARQKALAKMNAERRRQAELALARARQRQQALRRPARPAGRFIPRKQPVRNAPGGTRTAFRITSGELSRLSGALKGSADFRDRRLLRDVTAGRLLSAAEVSRARERLRLALAGGRPNRALAGALRCALAEDRRRRCMTRVVLALGRFGRVIVVYPDGTILAPGRLLGGGCVLVPPPGIDPCGPAVVYPCDPATPDGPGVVCSVDPATVDSGQDAGETADNEAPVDAVWHTTRNLRVSNGAKEKIKVKVQYEAVDASDQAGWFPQAPEDGKRALEFELQPGEVANLQDGDWRVNASRVRIWAEGGGQQWQQFRDRDLELVPERDDRGTPGYAAAEAQTFNVAFQ